MRRGYFRGKDMPGNARRPCCELCKNGWTDRDAVSAVGWGGLKEPCIRWGPDTLIEGAIVRGEGMPGNARRHFAVSRAKTAEPIEMPFGFWTRVGPRKHVLDGVQFPMRRGKFLGESTCRGMTDDTLPWAVQKWLNRSRCHLGCRLGWAQGSMCYMGCTLPPNTIEPSMFGRAKSSSGDAALCQINVTTC